jgi:DNA-damage-inducible protein J
MIQARVPDEIQEVASQVIKAAGLTVSDVVRVLMTRIARDKALPLEIFRPNAQTLEAFDEAERGGLERFATPEAMLANLNADC